MKTKKKIRTRVSTIQCPGCDDIIYSRARHDFHSCYCGKVSIDGGFDYCHVGWNPKLKPPIIHVKYINVTRAELYSDWNYRVDKFGTIKCKK